MDFYRLSDPRDHRRVGVAAHTDKVIDIAMQLSRPTAPPPPMGTFDLRLYDRSLLTDTVMGLAGNYGILFVSDRFRAVLEQVTLPPHLYFQGSLTHKNRVYRDYQCLIVEPFHKTPPPFDMERSEFYWLKAFAEFDQVGGPTKFKTWAASEQIRIRADIYDAVLTGQSKPDSGRTDAKLYLTPDVTQFDLFDVPLLGNGLTISERLYRLLVEARITGIDLTEAPWLRRA